VADQEHELKEAPYLLTDTERRGWGVACKCGWRSPLLDSPQEALDSGNEHLYQAGYGAGKRGWLARRRARKRERPQWDERRRD
jgi:hypothetical protein